MWHTAKVASLPCAVHVAYDKSCFFVFFHFLCYLFFWQDLIYADSQMRHMAKFVECLTVRLTAKSPFMPSAGGSLCRVSFSADDKLCCVLRYILTANTVYAVWLVAMCVLPWAADSKVFAMCSWALPCALGTRQIT
jgi:hypothetical protein